MKDSVICNWLSLLESVNIKRENVGLGRQCTSRLVGLSKTDFITVSALLVPTFVNAKSWHVALTASVYLLFIFACIVPDK